MDRVVGLIVVDVVQYVRIPDCGVVMYNISALIARMTATETDYGNRLHLGQSPVKFAIVYTT